MCDPIHIALDREEGMVPPSLYRPLRLTCLCGKDRRDLILQRQVRSIRIPSLHHQAHSLLQRIREAKGSPDQPLVVLLYRHRFASDADRPSLRQRSPD